MGLALDVHRIVPVCMSNDEPDSLFPRLSHLSVCVFDCVEYACARYLTVERQYSEDQPRANITAAECLAWVFHGVMSGAQEGTTIPTVLHQQARLRMGADK